MNSPTRPLYDIASRTTSSSFRLLFQLNIFSIIFLSLKLPTPTLFSPLLLLRYILHHPITSFLQNPNQALPARSPSAQPARQGQGAESSAGRQAQQGQGQGQGQNQGQGQALGLPQPNGIPDFLATSPLTSA